MLIIGDPRKSHRKDGVKMPALVHVNVSEFGFTQEMLCGDSISAIHFDRLMNGKGQVRLQARISHQFKDYILNKELDSTIRSVDRGNQN